MGEAIECQSCGTQGMGLYCSACGERRLDASQRSIRVLIGHALWEATSIDGKLLKTFKAFFFKPGFLSWAHWQGVRRPYMKPLTLFLLFNLLYFLMSPLTDFTLPLDNQKYQPYGAWLTGIIDDYLARSGRTFEAVAAEYDAVTAVVAKSIVILSVPFLIPFVWMANPSRKFFLVDHTVFALHAYSFLLVWLVIVAAFGGTAYYLFGEIVTRVSIVFFLIGFLTPLAYLIVAQRGMYGDVWWRATLKGLWLYAGLVFSHFVYRFVQFWLVWWQVAV